MQQTVNHAFKKGVCQTEPLENVQSKKEEK